MHVSNMLSNILNLFLAQYRNVFTEKVIDTFLLKFSLKHYNYYTF